jgi:DNA-binding response OmpR family regulator
VLKRSRIDDDRDDAATPSGAVMVVGTDRDACELVARLVEWAGRQVTRVYDPTTVVDQLSEGGVAAVVIDSRATGTRHAISVLEAVRTGGADTVVLVLADSDADRLTAYQAGTDGYLVRPFHADELVETLRSALGRSPEDRVSHRNVQLMGGAATS